MTEPITFVAVGQAGPQGSKTPTPQGGMRESSRLVMPWREAVKAAALEVRPVEPLDGPLDVLVVITLTRPKSAKKDEIAPSRKPDLSKLLRSTEDALTDAGIWVDDARAVNYVRLAKVWHRYDELALELPGAVIGVAPHDAHDLPLRAWVAVQHFNLRVNAPDPVSVGPEPADGWSPW